MLGGIVGLAGSVAILHGLSAWQPIPDIPINVPVNPDVRTYVVALLLALTCGFLFGMVPVRQVLRSDPWQMIRTGMSGNAAARRFTVRDVLLVAQVAICAVLVTSSLVAVRGLVRSLHSNFGFDPQHAVIAHSDLKMSGYSDDTSHAAQRRMIDAAAAIPGVSAAGLISNIPLSLSSGDSSVYKDTTTDFRPSNIADDAMDYNISPGYLQASGTRLLAGRDITYDDNKNSPTVALINRQFAIKVFGSVQKAVGGHFKFWGGNRAEVIGVVEDGKYRTLTEDPTAAMFFPLQQHASTDAWLVVRSDRDPSEIAHAIETSIHSLDSSLPVDIIPWSAEMNTALFPSRVASVALGVLGLLGAMLAVTGIFGMASYTVSKRLRELGIRVALGAGRRQILLASLGRALRLLAMGAAGGLVLGMLATRVLSHIVYQATPGDPLVLSAFAVTMLLLGLLAAWIPARRALAVDPLILLREE